MKTLFFPAKSKHQLNESKLKEVSKKLPKNLTIAYSIQFENLARQIKNKLSKEHKINNIIQVLGCSTPIINKKTEAILLVGSGKFHATGLAIATNLPIYILEQKSFQKISNQDIKFFKKQKKISYVKYLSAEKVGILVSTKPGQQRIKRALDFKKKSKKKSYLFMANNLDTNEFENFGLKSWINTACPRMDMNSPSIINLQDIENQSN